jgi:hypothetical protein
MKKVEKIIKKKGSSLEFIRTSSKSIIVKKKYELSAPTSVKEEFETINDFFQFLKKDNPNSIYKAISYDEKTKEIEMEFVKGETFESLLQRNLFYHSRDFFFVKITSDLGFMYKLIHENYIESKIDVDEELKKNQFSHLSPLIDKKYCKENIHYTQKVFSGALCNYIVNKNNITPIDLGSNKVKILTTQEIARHIVFYYISGIRPWHIFTYDWKLVKKMESTFLKSYLKTKSIPLDFMIILNISKLDVLTHISKRGKGIVKFFNYFYLKVFTTLYFYRVKSQLKKKNILKNRIKEHALIFNELKLNWSFYKGDITYPHVCSDLDIVCSETMPFVMEKLTSKGFKKINNYLYEKHSISYHFHYGYTTHNSFFGKDLGYLILNNVSDTKIKKPKYMVWLGVRFYYAIKRPRGWIKKMFKRLFWDK